MKHLNKMLTALLTVTVLAVLLGTLSVCALGSAVTVDVTGYNTGAEVTVSLCQDGDVKFHNCATMPKGGGAPTTRSIEVLNVTPGTYDVTVASDGCLTSTITDVVVDRAIHFGHYENEDLNEIELMAGDLDANGFIDSVDVTCISFDLFKSDETSYYSSSDLNGDTFIDALDITILSFNLLKSAPVIPFEAEVPVFEPFTEPLVESVSTDRGTPVTVTVTTDAVTVTTADSSLTLDPGFDRVESTLTFADWHPTVIGTTGSLDDPDGLILELSPVTAAGGAELYTVAHFTWDAENGILRKYVEYMVSGASDVHMTQVTLDTVDTTGENARENVLPDSADGANTFNYNSRPVYLTHHFLGIEFPVATTDATDTAVMLRHIPEVDMAENFWYSSRTEIVGITDGGRTSEEAFWDYLYPLTLVSRNEGGFFFNYDTWWSQYDCPFAEGRILDMMREWFGGISKFGGQVSCFTLDLGWDDRYSIWKIDDETWPDEFANIEEYAARYGSQIGFWACASSAYAPLCIDMDWAESAGYPVTDSPLRICLYDDDYAQELRDNIYYDVHNYNVGVLRSDGLYLCCNDPRHGHPGDGTKQSTIGTGAVEHSAENYIAYLKAGWEANQGNIQINSINTFGSSNPSPWWLMYCTVTNSAFGDDSPHGRSASPVYRASYTSARDFFAMQGLVNFDIPHEAQESFGLIHQTDDDFTNDFVSVLFRGHYFIDLYVNDDHMNDARYERLSQMMNWAQDNADSLLGDTEVITPASWNLTDVYPLSYSTKLWHETYGYKHDGLMMLRNPYMTKDTVTVTLPVAEGDTGTYDLISLYPEARVYAKNVSAGDPISVTLNGYETIVLQPVACGTLDLPIYTPAHPITVTDGQYQLDTSVRAQTSLTYTGTVTVSDETNRLYVLLEASTDPKTPAITIKVDGVSQTVHYNGTASDAWDADGRTRPESWLYAWVELTPGTHTVAIDMTEPDTLLNVSGYVWSTHTAASSVTVDNQLPAPEFLSDDSAELFDTNLIGLGAYIFANCDSTMQVQNAALTLDTANKREGSGSLASNNTDTVAVFPIMLGRAMDFSAFEENGVLHLWLYVSDASKLQKGLGRVEVSHDGGSSERNFTYWNIPDLSTGWNELILPIADADQNNADWTRINYLRVYQYVTAPVTISLDDVYLGNPSDLPDVCTVTFDGGTATGGTAPAAKIASPGANITLPECSFTHYGYTFTGWRCALDGTLYQPGAVYTMADATTFTAEWSEGMDTSFSVGLALADVSAAGLNGDTWFYMDGQGGGLGTDNYPPTSETFEGSVTYVAHPKTGLNIVQRYPMAVSVWQCPKENLALAFDLYLEDASVFNAAASYFNLISNSLVNDGYLQFYFTAAGTLEDGWNHITVPLSDTSPIIGTFDLFNITAVSLGLTFTENTTIALDEIRLVYCDSETEPDTPAADSILLAASSAAAASDTWFYMDGQGGALGTANSLPNAASYDGKTGFGAEAAAGVNVIQKFPLGSETVNDMPWYVIADGTASYQMKADFYIDSAAALTSGTMKLIAGSSEVAADGGAWTVAFSSASLTDGWNTLILPLTDSLYGGSLDVSSIEDLPLSAFNITFTASADVTVALADVRLEPAEAPEAPDGIVICLNTSASASDTWFYMDGQGGALGSANFLPNLKKYDTRNGFGSEAPAGIDVFQKYPLGSAEYNGASVYQLIDGAPSDYKMVCDFYISDASALGSGSVMKLIVGPSEADAKGGKWMVDLSTLGLDDGWNTVELPLTAAYYTGSLDAASLTCIPASAVNFTLFPTEDVVIAAADVRLVAAD